MKKSIIVVLTILLVSALAFVMCGVNKAPTATGVSITGTPEVGSELTGTYTYADEDADPEGTSTFRWMIADTETGDYAAIDGATALTYTPVAADEGKFIKFEVTPVAETGTTPGAAVMSDAVEIAAAGTGGDTCGTPTFTPASGSEIAMGGTGAVAITNPDPTDCTIYYTTDGSTPSASSTEYTAAIDAPGTAQTDWTVKAIAIADTAGWDDSAVATAMYDVRDESTQCLAPSLDPGDGSTISVSSEIDILDNACTVYYTTDGSDPVSGDDTTDPIVAPATATADWEVRAIAIDDSGTKTSSGIVSATYQVEDVTVMADVTFTPNGGSVNSGDTVTMECANLGDALNEGRIYYTVSNTEPADPKTAFESGMATWYQAPVTIDTNNTYFKAFAIDYDATNTLNASAGNVTSVQFTLSSDAQIEILDDTNTALPGDPQTFTTSSVGASGTTYDFTLKVNNPGTDNLHVNRVPSSTGEFIQDGGNDANIYVTDWITTPAGLDLITIDAGTSKEFTLHFDGTGSAGTFTESFTINTTEAGDYTFNVEISVAGSPTVFEDFQDETLYSAPASSDLGGTWTVGAGGAATGGMSVGETSFGSGEYVLSSGSYWAGEMETGYRWGKLSGVAIPSSGSFQFDFYIGSSGTLDSIQIWVSTDDTIDMDTPGVAADWEADGTTPTWTDVIGEEITGLTADTYSFYFRQEKAAGSGDYCDTLRIDNLTFVPQ